MVDWKDVGIRSLKTFCEIFVTVFMQELAGINLFDGSMTEVAWVGLILSSMAAAVTAVWNGVLEPLFKKTKPPEVTE
ncbi:MAG: hypothetical protein J6A48_11535 [Clostridia bacterium]|nr:hypothetical protein [Clostridia bacterium]